MTRTSERERGGPHIERRRFAVEVVEAPETRVLSHTNLVIGSSENCNLVVNDPRVSRKHLRIEPTEGGLRVVDLQSTNGTRVGGLRIEQVLLNSEAVVEIGNTQLRVWITGDFDRLPLYPDNQLGRLYGASVAMREVFAVLERVSHTNSTVLLQGPSGTGKELAAEALHDLSARRDGPYVVVDCGSLPASLIESELFGHEEGAFTGAVQKRLGAIELAHGGTLFLDEIGELELTLQSRLLRALANGEVRRLGASTTTAVDVRVVAATHRDLIEMVAEGSFREDLYYRLAVIQVELPPLRHRGDDVLILARRFLEEFAPDSPGLTSEQESALLTRPWAGNVRELRNFIQRVAHLGFARAVGRTRAHNQTEEADHPTDAWLPYADAREAALDRFEREYIVDLLKRSGGNVAQAARQAGIHRGYLFRLMRKHDISRPT